MSADLDAASLLALTLLLGASGMAEEAKHEVDADNTFALAVGPSVEVDPVAGALSGGAEASIEVELVPRWIELEAGVEAVGGRSSSELSVDLLIKKPFSLAPRLEIMPGLGPILAKSFGTAASTSFGVEVAVDLMWWLFSPRVGLGLEPSAGLLFASGAQASIGMTLGPIFGW